MVYYSHTENTISSCGAAWAPIPSSLLSISARQERPISGAGTCLTLYRSVYGASFECFGLWYCVALGVFRCQLSELIVATFGAVAGFPTEGLTSPHEF